MVELKRHNPDDIDFTYFADPKRADGDLLEYQIDLACNHPISTAVLQAFSGMVLVLNEHRQAVAVNDTVLRTLGISESKEALGLRPGEAASCRHAATAPNGCGTGRACITCGAALSIVACGRLKQPIERECFIARQVDTREEPLEFLVRAAPLQIDNVEFIVVTLLDISEKKRAEAMERIFIHDLLNCVQALNGLGDILAFERDGKPHTELSQIQDLTGYLCEMVNAHRDLMLMENGEFKSVLKDVLLSEIVERVQKIIVYSNASRQKSLVLETTVPEIRLMTDDVLLTRVLVNMAKNALEATDPGKDASLRCEVVGKTLLLSVWNDREIPSHTALRIFERYFSTKNGNGRGLGTYSMKLIGERYLGGKVTFDTTASGTTFTLSLPL